MFEIILKLQREMQLEFRRESYANRVFKFSNSAKN